MKRLLTIALALLLLTAGCVPAPTPPEAHTSTFLTMDTVMSVTVYGGTDDVLQRAEACVLDLEALLSVTDPDSEIYTLDRNGSATLSGDTAGLLANALELCERTGGALDLTIYPVVRAWGFTTGEYGVPDSAVIEDLLSRVDYTQVALDEAAGTASLPEGVEIDLGAVAKGYTGDVLTALLKVQGVDCALLELGGNIQTIGSKPDGSDWRVAIQDPTDGGGHIGVVSVSDKAVVTSGGYERYFEQDGVRYWHIIDPATGAPARTGLQSVTIVGDSGLECDALSTALFVMGLDDALDYWRANRDFEAIFVSDDGSVTITAGLADSFTLSGDRSLTIIEP